MYIIMIGFFGRFVNINPFEGQEKELTTQLYNYFTFLSHFFTQQKHYENITEKYFFSPCF